MIKSIVLIEPPDLENGGKSIACSIGIESIQERPNGDIWIRLLKVGQLKDIAESIEGEGKA